MSHWELIILLKGTTNIYLLFKFQVAELTVTSLIKFKEDGSYKIVPNKCLQNASCF